MHLPDFTQFAPFNDLRARMGADQLGYFELFDPRLHLTGAERSELARGGRLLAPDQLRVLADRTLAIKNSRVLAYDPDEAWYRSRREYPTYHLAWCAVLDALVREHPGREVLATTHIDDEYDLLRIDAEKGVRMVRHGFVVCRQCLHTLRYRDYDEYRNRRRGYSQQVLADFKLSVFYQQYRQYPLSFEANRRSHSGS